MKETFSYYVVLELRADTEPEENEIEVDIVKDKNYYGGESGLYQNLDDAREVMEKRIKEIAEEDDWDCDENHFVGYFINGLDGYVYMADKEDHADKDNIVKNNFQYDWVYKRYYIKEIKF